MAGPEFMLGLWEALGPIGFRKLGWRHWRCDLCKCGGVTSHLNGVRHAMALRDHQLENAQYEVERQWGIMRGQGLPIRQLVQQSLSVFGISRKSCQIATVLFAESGTLRLKSPCKLANVGKTQAP